MAAMPPRYYFNKDWAITRTVPTSNTLHAAQRCVLGDVDLKFQSLIWSNMLSVKECESIHCLVAFTFLAVFVGAKSTVGHCFVDGQQLLPAATLGSPACKEKNSTGREACASLLNDGTNTCTGHFDNLLAPSLTTQNITPAKAIDAS
jgi:hypothetical protein